MALTVNTLAEVPDASGYIVELELAGTGHPADRIDRDRIRDELEMDEWYVRTADQAEHQALMAQVDKEVDFQRLPAYLLLTAHPTEATEGVVIYLDAVKSEEAAWAVLQAAIAELRALTENSTQASPAEFVARHLTERTTRDLLTLSANAITVINFVI